MTIREFQIADGASSTAAESVRGAGENRSQASTDKAACRVGRSLFGDTWIGSLTGRERWLIERYVDRQETSSIIASGVTFFGPGGPIPAVNDPALRAEIEAALDRRDWMKSQYDRAYDWLESRGFDIESDTLDADAFRRAFVSRFPAEIAPSARPKDHDKKAVSSPLSPSLASARSCGPRKRGRKPTVRESVTAKMLSDIDANSITREQLGAMQEKILSERYGVSRDTARKARNDVLGGS